MGDPNRVQQIVWNLLSNAIKFTPPGGQVHVDLGGNREGVELGIRDTGIGIAPGFIAHVFERFRQADSSSTRAHSGVGLGLSIVRHLVELHHGSVEAHSEGPGKGAYFVVRFPAAGREAGSQDGAGDSSRQASVAGVRVLLVEDDADARDLLEEALAGSGAVVTAADSAEGALAALAIHDVDIIVSDIGMPGEDGYSLLRKVRSLAPADGGRVPAVALTAYAREEDRMRALRAGYQVHVAKPINPTEFVAVVGALAGVTARK
jgi:CheY-like chemotaxis protein